MSVKHEAQRLFPWRLKTRQEISSPLSLSQTTVPTSSKPLILICASSFSVDRSGKVPGQFSQAWWQIALYTEWKLLKNISNRKTDWNAEGETAATRDEHMGHSKYNQRGNTITLKQSLCSRRSPRTWTRRSWSQFCALDCKLWRRGADLHIPFCRAILCFQMHLLACDSEDVKGYRVLVVDFNLRVI